jgi:serine O-acetyltransferase
MELAAAPPAAAITEVNGAMSVETEGERTKEHATERPEELEWRGPPPGLLDTLLSDIEWSGGPVEVADDKDPQGWRAKGLDPKRLTNCLQFLGFYATVMYRVSRWCYLHKLKVLAAPIQVLNTVVTGAEISHKADIGPGFRIGHSQGLFVGPNVKLGFRSTMNQGTCLSSNLEADHGAPVVGNYLYMSPGSKVFGNVKIGHRVWIGPNSVALKDIESDKVVLGVPGRAMPPTFRNSQA